MIIVKFVENCDTALGFYYKNDIVEIPSLWELGPKPLPFVVLSRRNWKTQRGIDNCIAKQKEKMRTN